MKNRITRVGVSQQFLSSSGAWCIFHMGENERVRVLVLAAFFYLNMLVR